MRILDSHFHYWPRSFFEELCSREEYPKAFRNPDGGYDYRRKEGALGLLNLEPEWFDLDAELAHMDSLGHQIDVIGSIGPLSVHFSDVPLEQGIEDARHWNQAMAAAQRAHPGRFWGTAAVPLTDTKAAIETLDHAIGELGLVGVNVPGSVGSDARIDAERLEPFYARVAELGVPMFIHPTDAIFQDLLGGYDGALHLTLGRVMEVSAAALRLIFSGILERNPGLRVIMSHTGGALPYQAGRIDKNGARAGLRKPPSAYMKAMFTDTVSPHTMGLKFAIDYYGIDNVMYGTDYPCWDPATALRLLAEIDLTNADREKLLRGNAMALFGLENRERKSSTRT